MNHAQRRGSKGKREDQSQEEETRLLKLFRIKQRDKMGLAEKGRFEQTAEGASEPSGEKELQAEGTASAKALRQEEQRQVGLGQSGA